jgi:hypothetical protein
MDFAFLCVISIYSDGPTVFVCTYNCQCVLQSGLVFFHHRVCVETFDLLITVLVRFYGRNYTY